MPASIEDLFVHNRAWAARMERERPGFFTSLLAQQKPGYMWIGCSDSRVPANQITGLEPGEVFVHRNVANVVVPSDLNCLSTIQYAVDQLHVEHIMVVGHYGCGGVRAALDGARVGLADNWIRHVQDVRDRHRGLIASIAPEWRYDVLCELNAIEQVLNLAQTTVVRDAWERGQKVWLHGWCYGLKDGLINDLRMTVDGAEGLDALHRAAIAGVAAAKR
ncbi:carbonate dehydratase [Verminephrobacter aporrectodeae subsp. tuberculatae]|uniref:carbonate dehydratase n=1 Tax=Verminephrobacter aporrectodeae TaxID=1110389 RepID=UPI0022371BFB|nr:carbonate dehydratase [Verminephrobacter aporrectodeae]MCW5222978.1 carbonate dehydratase [Verminephrobacter aporrectodeae subsp. tuberculatae]MCW5288442.1 carbonate dehydratase [Verminephrobacter aporrectodeae subsp. tuberculatae]MCW8200102.1 carbonate dehydratase [Verminephrobacter aporrectodeae subsp. tuberculatae]